MEGIATNRGKAAPPAVLEARSRARLEVFRTARSAQALGGRRRELCPDDRSAYSQGFCLRWTFRGSRISVDRLTGLQRAGRSQPADFRSAALASSINLQTKLDDLR